MGFMHDVKSDILSIEERANTIILTDTSDGEPNIFFNHPQPEEIRDQIARALMSMAGLAYSQDKMEEAERLRQCAHTVKTIEVCVRAVHSIEVEKVWLRDLYKFLSDSKILLDED